MRGHLDLVVELVGPRFSGVVGGSPEGTLLHHAAWIGAPELVEKLLVRGADPGARSPAKFDTPLGWTALASQYWELPGRDFVGVAERLARAGGVVETHHLEVAEGPLYDWLDERLRGAAG